MAGAYFTEYVEHLSPVVHKVSRTIINLILDKADNFFSKEDISSIYKESEEMPKCGSMFDDLSNLDLQSVNETEQNILKGLDSFKSFSLGSKNSSLNVGLKIASQSKDQGMALEEDDSVTKSNLEHIDKKLPKFCQKIKPVVNKMLGQLYFRIDLQGSDEQTVISEIKAESELPTRYDTTASEESKNHYQFIQNFDISINRLTGVFYNCLKKCKTIEEVKFLTSNKGKIMRTLICTPETEFKHAEEFGQLGIHQYYKSIVQRFDWNLGYVFLKSMAVCGMNYINAFQGFGKDIDENKIDNGSCIDMGSILNLSSSIDFKRQVGQTSGRMSMYY